MRVQPDSLAMSRLRPDNTLLLLIDMQERLQPLIHEDELLRANSAALAEGARLLGVPTMITEQYPKGLGHTIPELRSAVDHAGGVLEKTAFSCASDASIAARITAAARPNILVAGIEAHICVLQTTLDLLEAGYGVHVVEDAVGARDPRNKEAGIARARRHGAEPSTVEMALFELMGGKDHPQFKAVQALIK
jgi:nicotinamidase-related amidase